MITYCPRCGAEWRLIGYPRVARNECPECALALITVPNALAPSGDEVAYGLDEWPTADRAVITAALIDAQILYRWESDYTLVVHASYEADVDRLLDDVEGSAAATTEEGEDSDPADGGPDAQAAMADLFVAADRLRHVPSELAAKDAFIAASIAVLAQAPPYGVDARLWNQIRDRAATIVADLHAVADSDVVAEQAMDLRTLLRDFV